MSHLAVVIRLVRWTALSLLLVGCGAPPVELEADEVEPASAAATGPLSSIDCSESSDTGYTSGSPFPITVVTVDGKKVEKDTANAYYVMARAAEAAGVQIRIVSGFRTMAEQQHLYDCYVNCSCNNCNLAAKPGYSNHQSGHALDLNTSAGGVLAWLNANGGAFGFKRTVPSEAWHWEWWGGGPGGGPCVSNRPPRGYLDSAACDGIRGWAQDEDEAARAIDVHVYFGGPAGSGAPGVPTSANQKRDDLCSAIGSCDHGYALPAPFSLFDGDDHPVFAYGIDSQGGANAGLGSSPRNLNCSGALPAGVRRHVVNPTSYSAWRFDAFWDRMPASDAALAPIEQGEPMPATPRLARVDGEPAVWLIDAGFRRHIPSPAVMDAWRFDWNSIESLPASELMALPEGPVVQARPMLVQGSDPAVYVLDTAFPENGGASSGGAAGSAQGGAGGGGAAGAGWGGQGAAGSANSQSRTESEADGGCTLAGASAPAQGSAGLGLLLLAVGGLRRRR